MVEEVTASKVAKTKAEFPAVVVKGMFADRVAHPKMWDLIDILFDVYYQLQYQIWNLQYAGETDFSEVEALWVECLSEFGASAADSFAFWFIPETVDAGASVSMSLEEATEVQETVTKLAGMIENAQPGDVVTKFRNIGKSLIEIAVKSGIPIPETNAETDVTKSTQFLEQATLTATAEAKVKELETTLEKTNEDLEVTKAGLKAAVEATSAALRQPLHFSAGQD